MSHQPSQSLLSRTFVGLLLAQFTTTFNDQAIHMTAVFYAADMLVRFVHISWIDEKAVVSIVTACFITPFLLFSSFAGPLGDRFSKRSVIVFWKVAEVGMMGLALAGLLLPHLAGSESESLPTIAVWSAALVISTVFLMGLHSTFFVPAKLGAMPEILEPSVLSRGNGVLEGTSFTAQILGTSAGGVLYALLKGDVAGGRYEPGREWVIGALLFVLALLGTVTAALMERLPPAAPGLKINWNWWRPLKQNLGILWRSKPLTLSVTGIAFCVFMTLFLRQTLLFQGELEKELKTARTELARVEGRSAVDAETEMDRLLASVLPGRLEKAAQESELRVALLFALVGLGVGLGSIAAGYLSGHRVELGLVPIGALSIVLFTFLPAWLAERPLVFIGCLFGIGVGAGFYLVPLYTLLQHRAPKESKGNVVSASNFLNVLGGIVSVGAFYLIALALDGLLGARLTELDVAADKSLLPTFVADLESQMRIPRLLFLAACVCTVGAVLILVRRLPDFFVRSAIWLSAWGHNPLRTSGVEHMPLDGAVILVTNCSTFASALDLIAAVDRHPNIVLIEEPGSERDQHLLRTLAARSCLLAIDGRASDGALWQQASQLGAHALMRGEMMALTAPRDSARQNAQRLFEDWRQSGPATVVPVYCSRGDGPPTGRRPFVVFGNPLDGQTDLAAARAAIDRLAPGQTN